MVKADGSLVTVSVLYYDDGNLIPLRGETKSGVRMERDAVLCCVVACRGECMSMCKVVYGWSH